MGACCGSGSQTCRIVFVGLDNAGKSSILDCLADGRPPMVTKPTIGYRQKTIHRHKIELQIWDVGGDEHGRDLWRHYVKNAHAVVFILDSSDEYHLDQCGDESAKKELHRVLKNDELPFTSPLLIYANKQDRNGALRRDRIEKRLELQTIKTRPWHIAESIALHNEGIEEGIDWLCETLHTQIRNRKNNNR